jgi:prefoldin subunit 5
MQKYDWAEDGMQPLHYGDYYSRDDVDCEISELQKRIKELEDNNDEIQKERDNLQEQVEKLQSALEDIGQAARRSQW